MVLSQVLDVLCSLCVCHGMAVRSNQHLICDNLLPERDLLLQTRLVNQVTRYTTINNPLTHTEMSILHSHRPTLLSKYCQL